jgi:hypothetical protein
MLYAHAISGSADAARFLSPEKPSAAPKIAADILEVKLKTYLKFNETYPGFGGLLPWFSNAEGSDSIEPTWDWVNRIPALDNGFVPLFCRCESRNRDLLLITTQRIALGRLWCHPGNGEEP